MESFLLRVRLTPRAAREQIDGWVATQLPYVRDFADAVVAARGDRAAQQQIEARIGLWVEALRILGQVAKASADANAMGTWVFGDTVHCADCAKLNGQRHRVKWFIQKGWIPREPGAPMECGGWNCECKIVSDDGWRLL